MIEERPKYTLIFAFDPEGSVLLRKKTHPTVQEGAWNGLGGLYQADLDFTLFDNGDGYGPFRMCARRKFTEEAAAEVDDISRFKGPIVVVYPEADLLVFWLDLTEEEAAVVAAIPVDDDLPEEQHEEFNAWCTVDDVNDMVNSDWGNGQLVESTWEYLELIKSFRYRWEETP